MTQDFKKKIFKKHNVVDSRKIKFLARLLGLTLFATFISCNEELYNIKDQHNGVDKNKISLTQFKNETAINKFENIFQIKTSNGINNKSKVALSEFYIDTLAIKKLLSQNQKTTYTFRIYPLFKKHNDNEYYNLVYKKVDGAWIKTVFLLNKKITQNKEDVRFETIEKIGLDEKENSKNQKTAMLCYQYHYEVKCNGSCDGPCDGFACTTGECLAISVTVGSCGGSGSSTTGSVDTSAIGEGLSDGGSTGGLDDGFVFSPNTFKNLSIDDPNYINEWQKSNVWANLSGPMKAFFTESQDRMNYFNETIQYQIDNNWSDESYEFANWARDFKFGNADTSWNDVIELSDYFKNSTDPLKKEIAGKWLKIKKELAANPTFLLKIPCAEIIKWQALVKFSPPQSVKDKIQKLDNQSMLSDYNIQYLEHASGAAINLDYFPVTINTLPKNPATSIKFTPTQFLNYVRLNINNFVDTNISRFSPTTLTTGYNESQIWNSSNPLGAIIHIDIPFPAGDGSVICSQSDSNHWVFTTLEVPYGSGSNADGIHPVSGNREFGLIQNSNGTYTFYTRGVDRMTDSFDQDMVSNLSINPFENPDLLWNSLKTKVANFVQNNGGSSVTPTNSQNVIWRPDWAKVRDVLKGLRPMSDLGCK